MSSSLLPKEIHLAQAGLAQLPSDWSIIELQELLSEDRGISVGVMYPGKHEPSGIPLIKVGSIKNGMIDPNPEFRITAEKHNEYRRTALEGGELLITLVGNIGQCAIVPPEMKDWNAARAIAVLRLKNPKEAKFIRFCLLSHPLQHLMNVWATTTVQATLNLKEIKQLPLPWPPSFERDSISNILETIEKKIELNRQTNETLEAIARALFKSWFVDFDPVRAKMEGQQPFGMSEEIAELFPDGFEDSVLGEIPRGWTVKPLSEFVDINPVRKLHSGQIAPYLEMSNMPNSLARVSKWENRAFTSGMKFINGDTLVARITPCLENGKTAFVDFLDEGEVGWGSTEYIVFHSKAPLPPEYSYFIARSDTFRAHAIRNMTGTSGRQRVQIGCFDSYLVTVPSSECASLFGTLAKSTMAAMKQHDEESQTLASIRDLLLPKLLSGEIRIKDAEKLVEAAV